MDAPSANLRMEIVLIICNQIHPSAPLRVALLWNKQSQKKRAKKSRKKNTNTHKQNTVAFLIKCKQFTFIEIRLISETRKSSEKRQKERSVLVGAQCCQLCAVTCGTVLYSFVVVLLWRQVGTKQK